MRKVRLLLRIFRQRPWVTAGLVALAVSSSVTEGIGIGFLVPLLETINAQGEAIPESQVSVYLAAIFNFLGIPYLLWTLALGGFLLFMVQIILKYLRETYTTLAGSTRAADVRKQLFDNLIRTDLTYIQRKRGGDFVNPLITEPNRVQAAFSFSVNLLAFSIESAVFLAIALFLSWSLTLAAIVLVGGITFIVKYEMKRATDNGIRLTEINSNLQNTAVEHLSGIRILKAFNLENFSSRTFGNQANELPRIYYAVAKSAGRLQGLFQIGLAGGLLLAVYFAITLLNISVPMLLTFIFILYRLYPKIGGMNKALHQINFAIPGVENVLRLIAETENPSIQSGTRQFSQLQNEIRFEDVTFGYDDEAPILEKVNLTIGRGKITALVGSSGAGKTTLINLLMRFYDCSSGRILVDGTDLKELDLTAWRGAIALVNQDTFLFNDTVRSNIAIGKTGATDLEIEDAAKRANADEFIQELPQKYETIGGDRGVRLSGGQRQRLALARAVVRDPQVLILDEATSELDSKSEQLIRQAVDELGQERTIITIAHRLSTIRNADKILVLENGRVVEEGDHDSLVGNDGHYAEYLRAQDTVAAKLN